MGKFQLFFSTDNAAFDDLDSEVVRILRETADRIEREGTPDMFRTIHDINGNDVGRYAVKSHDYR
jgi:nitrogen fixation-related uncharacterized protein